MPFSKALLRRFIPPIFLDLYRKIKHSPPIFSGDYATWQSAVDHSLDTAPNILLIQYVRQHSRLRLEKRLSSATGLRLQCLVIVGRCWPVFLTLGFGAEMGCTLWISGSTRQRVFSTSALS